MTVPATVLDRLLPDEPRDEDGVEARRWLDAHGLPDAHDESWRYSPVDEIIRRVTGATPAPPGQVTRPDVDRLAGEHGAVRLVFVNGTFAPELSDVGGLGAGVSCGPLSGLPRGIIRADLRTTEPVTEGFQALNRGAGGDPCVVHTAPGAESGEPIHIVHVSAAGTEPGIAHPRAVVLVGDHSRLHVIETFTGLGGSAVTNADTDIRLGVQAHLTHHRIQTESPGAVHIGRTGVGQEAGSSYHATSLMIGAEIARHAINVTLSGPGAQVDLDGLYRPAGDQRHDLSVCVDHAASGGVSTQQFKGVIDDQARGAFSGRIIVRPGTVATDARQTNRNLVLQPTAKADTRPWLEIFADDVRCAHGATVGRLDDDALFYLRSRGIPGPESRRILIDAFVAEIAGAIEPASLREHVASLLDAAPERARS
jgi:Fe-S cluster assembly protein SufD